MRCEKKKRNGKSEISNLTIEKGYTSCVLRSAHSSSFVCVCVNEHRTHAGHEVKKANEIYYFIAESLLFGCFFPILIIQIFLLLRRRIVVFVFSSLLYGCVFSVASTSEMGLSNNNICFSSLSALNIYYYFFFCFLQFDFFSKRAVGTFFCSLFVVPSMMMLMVVMVNRVCLCACTHGFFRFPFMPSAAETFRICAIMFGCVCCVCLCVKFRSGRIDVRMWQKTYAVIQSAGVSWTRMCVAH